MPVVLKNIKTDNYLFQESIIWNGDVTAMGKKHEHLNSNKSINQQL